MTQEHSGPGHNGSGGLTNALSNRPFIVGLLFLGTYFVPFLILIGLALAYVFKGQPEEEWEVSHFHYLIRTFWLLVIAAIVLVAATAIAVAGVELAQIPMDYDRAFIPALAVVGLLFMAVLALCGVRIVLSLMKSVAHKPMPKPKSWTF